MYENIPDELRQLKHWCCYKLIPDETRQGKYKKTPMNPFTGGNGQSNNTSTWSTFNVAMDAIKKFNFDGLGFYFANGYFGVDIDGIDDDITAYKNGDTDNIVYEFINTLQSYSEYSISGKGLHIICKGELPKTGRRKGNVEMYSSGRFFCMTGNIAAEYMDINDCTEQIKELHSKYIGGKAETVAKPVVNNTNLSDNDIIQLALKSKNGTAFKILYEGSWEGFYDSQSSADITFCNMLAFWCQCNPSQMDMLFRQSGLMRDKWDRKQSGSTYGAITIDKAIQGCKVTYSPTPKYSVFIEEPKAKRKVYSFDDTGNANRFKDLIEKSVRYSYTNRSWIFFNGQKWVEDVTGQIKSLADETIERMKIDFADCKNEDEEKVFTKHLKATRSSKGKTAMIKETEHLLSITQQALDNFKYLLNVSNGIVDLKKGNLIKHDAEKFLTKVINYEYSDKVDCPLWESFLNQIFNNDKDLIRYIQKAIGYSLTGNTEEQCAFFCYGTGRNGKSTFLDIISEIMGDYAINIQPETIMIRPGSSGASSDIARLKGARFVTSVEPNEGLRLNEGLVKQLTGGDKVTARKLYGNEFEFIPEFKLWMGTNHKPIIRGTDLGIWRRIRLIPFLVQIAEDKIDKNLKVKLQNELTGILNWAVEGCLLWKKEGLNIPSAIQQATNEYKSEMDVISSWLSECCEVTWASDEKASDLYKSYSDWANENNEYKMSNTKFGLEISKRHEKIQNRNGIFYKGLKLIGKYKPYSVNYQ